MSKRTASSDLNHDNWDHEDKPEDAGTFKQAAPEALKGRVIRTAKRRGVAPAAPSPSTPVSPNVSTEEAPKNIFASFTAFNKSEGNLSSPKTVFSFLSSSSNGGNTSAGADSMSEQGTKNSNKASNGIDNSPVTSDSGSKESKDREYYFRKLKGLNESVSKWIVSHVSSNPFCILTPVFRDYEKHLATIQSTHCKEESSANKEDVRTVEPKTEKESTEEIAEIKPVSEKKLDDEVVISKLSEDKPSFSTSIFGSSSNSTSTASATFSFGSSSVSPTGGFSGFGSKNTSFSFGAGGTSSPSAGFSFGAGKPFVFGNVAKPETNDDKAEEGDEEDAPPKPDHKPVNEDGAVYTKRCKMFIKKDSTYSERGIGNLFLKPVEGGRTQLIVRADTSLGNVLLNVLLGPSLPIQKVGTNNVAVVYMPPPQEAQDTKQDDKEDGKPVTALLRVKTSDDADELLETLEKYKKTE